MEGLLILGRFFGWVQKACHVSAEGCQEARTNKRAVELFLWAAFFKQSDKTGRSSPNEEEGGGSKEDDKLRSEAEYPKGAIAAKFGWVALGRV